MVQILVIDDDAAIGQLLKRTLTRQGYEVTIASDGKEGLIQAQNLRPALVICDWIMPRLNGLEVCRQIKAMPELATTFFILLTSLGSVEDRVKGLDAGADDFLCKPIEMYELQARVRSGLRLHQLSRDLQMQKQLLENELAQAAEYVRSLLPAPMNVSSVTIDAQFIPSRQLGGDVFDYYWLDSENLVIYLLDMAGHGLQAALPSLSVMNLLKSKKLSSINYYQPSAVLKGLNETFQMTDKHDHYFTIWYGVYNRVKRQLIYSSAGHPPAVLFSAKPTPLKTPGLPVGMFYEAKYVDALCEVEPSSILYIFSDGIYEIIQTDGTVWGLDAFIDLLADCQKSWNFDLSWILRSVQYFNPQDYFDDDLSLLQIKFK